MNLVFQETDNPDLRDRGYIYWRLLSTDPRAAKEVVLAEKPLISEETDLLEPTLLDELICHIGSLASVYHKPPSTFVEGRLTVKKNLPLRSKNYDEQETHVGHYPTSANQQSQQVVIGNNVGSLIDDFDILGIMPTASSTNIDTYEINQNPTPLNAPNLLDDELSSILGFDSNVANTNPSPFMNTTTSLPVNRTTTTTTSGNELEDLFGDLNLTTAGTGISLSNNNVFVPPKEVSL